jgi:ribosomal subunit interface protein
MRVQVVSRHCDVPLPVRMRAEERAGRLLRYDTRLTHAELVFEEERHVKRVDGILAIEGGEPIVAHGEGEEFAQALDQAIGRLAKILRRSRAQIKDHQAPKLSDLENAGE